MRKHCTFKNILPFFQGLFLGAIDYDNSDRLYIYEVSDDSVESGFW